MFNLTMPENSKNPVVKTISLQQGVFRTNCVDCLDRTNAWMTKIGFLAVKDMFRILKIRKEISNLSITEVDSHNHEENSFMHKFKNIWADNGDHVSKLYTGTGATTSSTTRHGHGGLKGLIDHKSKSINRYFGSKF